MTTKPFTLKGGPPKAEQCQASRCPDESIIRYGADTSIGRHFHKRSVALCDRHHKMFWRWLEVTQPVAQETAA